MYLPYTHVNDTCRIKFKTNINKRRIKLDAMKYIIYHAPIYIFDPTPIVQTQFKDSIG